MRRYLGCGDVRRGLWINAAFHKSDKVTLAFTYETNANLSIRGGVIVFRQP